MTVVVVMGVSGSGKSRVGGAVADRLGWLFVEADDHHPPANVAKMSEGVPLDDADRAPWLAELNAVIRRHQHDGEDVVLACSALKRAYRDRLREGVEDLRFVHLDVSPEVVTKRVSGRQGHFMPPELIDSQFADLEPPGPTEALVIDADRPVEAIVEEVVEAIG